MRLLVPAYGYPTEVPELWEQLCAAPGSLEAVIVNVHDGPGCATDPHYESAVARLRAVGAPMAGYVDLAYGLRTVGDVVRDARAWAGRYGIETLFLDQVPSAWTPALAHLAGALRSAAPTRLIANPGTWVEPAVASLFDLIVEREHAGTSWPTREPLAGSQRAWILHSTPTSAFPSALERAEAQGVTALWVTELGGPNPYRALPRYWEELLRACSGGPVDRMASSQGGLLPAQGVGQA